MKLDNWESYESTLLAFESAWQSGTPQLADFVDMMPVSCRFDALVELVLIDFEYRLRAGEEIELDRYLSLYPALRDDRGRLTELVDQEKVLRGRHERIEDIVGNRCSDGDQSELGFAGGASQVDHLASGVRVNQYIIDGQLGRGAFAVVYRARDTRLNRDVALKFLSTRSMLSENLRTRMLREARAQASLQHRYIVPIFEIGQCLGQDFIVSRFVDGLTLEGEIQAAPVNTRRAVEIVAAISQGLHHAHQAGIVHRDVKPANVMMENGVPLLLDFGLAQLTDASQLLTHEGDLVGTPAYMSPEQADGRAWKTDPRSDVYSLGAVLYRMTCGRLPFEGTTPQVLYKVLNQTPRKPQSVNPKIATDLQKIMLKCLEKEPADRYQSARELDEDLRRFLLGEAVVARPVGRIARLVKWSRRRPAVASLVLGVILLAMFLGGAGSQLRRVGAERDRAETAEAETQKLFAKSAADAGRLAMQRGRTPQAIKHFKQSMRSGYRDRADLLLRLVEANFVLGNRRETARLISDAIEDPNASAHEASLEMWKLELALDGNTEHGDIADLLSNAVDYQSVDQGTAADAAYVAGLACNSTPQAIEHCREAIASDSFHYRARRLLTICLLSLMRLDEANNELAIARQLFPESDDFRLLDALNQGLDGGVSHAAELIDACELAPVEKSEWKEFCDLLSDIRTSSRASTDGGDLSMNYMMEIADRFRVTFRPMVRERRWHLPLQVEKSLASFAGQLSNLVDRPHHSQVGPLSDLARAHPEGSLLMLLGDRLLAGVLSEEGGLDRETQIKHVERSRNVFRSALELESDSLIPNLGIYGRKGIYATSMTLAFAFDHEKEANLGTCIRASSKIPVESITDEALTRTFALIAYSSNDPSEARRWLERRLELLRPDDDRRRDAIWTLAVLNKQSQDWQKVILRCDELIARQQADADVLALRRVATEKLQGIMEQPTKKNNAF